MKIATWNVNSVKARLPAVEAWLKEAAPDVVALQEIKSTEDSFPAATFEDLGYNTAVHGQKTYNGVAILSKRPLEDVTCGLPGFAADEQARYIEALVPGDAGMVRVASIYAPNGNPVGTEKFAYKQEWTKRLKEHAANLLAFEEPLALMGDFNVIPEDADCHDPKAWEQDAVFQPESRAGLRGIINLGYTDAFRAKHSAPGHYTFWDYQAGAWAKNHGIRIDFILLSPQALDRLEACAIDKDVRGREKPSDHAPVWCELKA
jgi:exodeoxyribonuclease III